jgi:hypothetical protein
MIKNLNDYSEVSSLEHLYCVWNQLSGFVSDANCLSCTHERRRDPWGSNAINCDQMAWFLRLALTMKITTLCEVGFTTGHISALFLAFNRNATAYSFDLFTHNDVGKTFDFLNKVYNNRAIAIAGNPAVSISEFARQFAVDIGKGLRTSDLERFPDVRFHPSWLHVDFGIRCDLVFVDGSFNGKDSLMYLRNFAFLSHPSTLIIFDNVCANCLSANDTVVSDRLNTWVQLVQGNLVTNARCLESSDWQWGFCVAKYSNPILKSSSNLTKEFNLQNPTYDAWSFRQNELAFLSSRLSQAAQYSPDHSTVILIPVTVSFQNLAINLWCNFKKLNIRNVLFWALSESLANTLTNLNIPCYFNPKFSTTNVVARWHQPQFNVMMRERFTLLQDILELGFNFIFCDADIVFMTDFRAQITNYSRNENCDIVIQTDTNSRETLLEPNGGFYFVRSGHQSLRAFQLLQQFLFVNPNLEDQEALTRFARMETTCVIGIDPRFRYLFPGAVNESAHCKPNTTAKMCFLDPFRYVPGRLYFDAHNYWKTHAQNRGITGPIMVHGNGWRDKEKSFKSAGLWFLSNNLNCTAN